MTNLTDESNLTKIKPQNKLMDHIYIWYNDTPLTLIIFFSKIRVL
jgi:hypothetical protein